MSANIADGVKFAINIYKTDIFISNLNKLHMRRLNVIRLGNFNKIIHSILDHFILEVYGLYAFPSGCCRIFAFQKSLRAQMRNGKIQVHGLCK